MSKWVSVGVTMSLPSVPKVMLVEDDPQFVYLIQRYARSSGCQVIHVDSISQTVLLAQKELPNLILLDLALNGTDDWHGQSRQVLQALKADPITCKIRVFVCSASEVATRGWEDYADGCLLKPVMYEDFMAALATTISDLPSDATRHQGSRT
jgi:CheY-like chemotaxis protein